VTGRATTGTTGKGRATGGRTTGGRTTVRPGRAAAPDPDVPVFVISVAAELTGLHAQTLRTYDRLGLVSPGRTGGGGRRYSWRDIELLREVAELTSAGIGLEGVRRILELEHQVDALQRRVEELESDLATTDYALHQTLTHQQGLPTLPRTNLPAVRSSTSTGQSMTIWRRGRS
jgi:MerR family transcriptional regulator/heat shock protein HspR